MKEKRSSPTRFFPSFCLCHIPLTRRVTNFPVLFFFFFYVRSYTRTQELPRIQDLSAKTKTVQGKLGQLITCPVMWPAVESEWKALQSYRAKDTDYEGQRIGSITVVSQLTADGRHLFLITPKPAFRPNQCIVSSFLVLNQKDTKCSQGKWKARC